MSGVAGCGLTFRWSVPGPRPPKHRTLIMAAKKKAKKAAKKAGKKAGKKK
jgi:hypothetical protein